MAPRKTRKCTVCDQVFKRAHNVTLHMKTHHKNYVQKIICPICKQLVSTMTNLRVHLKREGERKKVKYRLENKKIDGQPIKRIWVPAKSLNNGRFYGDNGDDSSSYSDADCVPLNILAQQWANGGKDYIFHNESVF